MKKRFLSLILCIYLLVSPVLELSVFGTEGDTPVSEGETAAEQSAALEWMSYEDFLWEESLRTWDYPSVYVGSEAVFAVDDYTNFRLAPTPEYIQTLAEASLLEESAQLAAENAALLSDGATDTATAEEESAPAAETEGISAGGSDSEEAPETAALVAPAVDEQSTEAIADAAAEDETEGEEPNDGYIYIDSADLLDENGRSIRVVITDYVFIPAPEESTLLTCGVWFRVAAADGYTLPEALQNNPYVQHLAYSYDVPALLIDAPIMGMFTGESVALQKETVGAARQLTYPVSLAPATFPVEHLYNDSLYWYDLGDISAWSWEDESITQQGITEPQNYHYVSESSVVLIPAVATITRDKLLNAETKAEYEELKSAVPQEILDLFPPVYTEQVDRHHQELIENEGITLDTAIDYNGISLPVTVRGKIPADAVLSVSPVTAEQVASEGFSVRATDIITALDIKIYNADGTEWQPAEGELVELSIGMAALGVADNTVVKLHHKHDGVIVSKDVFVVMDGFLTVLTDGFSIYVVDAVRSTNRTGQQINPNNANNPLNIDIGQTIVYYFNDNNNSGTWIVNDPEGAIYYTVHSENTDSTQIGHTQTGYRWIQITGLKETTTPITLTYATGNSNQTYYLNVNVPEAPANGKLLYIKDNVNQRGVLTATLVDDDGNEITDGLDGAAFEWTRSDGLFIIPEAYEDNYHSVNIARDHGGLTESKMNTAEKAYIPTTYTLKATLADGSVHTASYTVHYQSEIINAGFEFPDSKYRDYSFFPNGYPELYWKTTAPGTGSGNITKDIEYGDVTDQTNANQGETSYGVYKAADYATGGDQFAELNAEAVGALYQDIISVPEENIEWKFSHAARPDQSWASNVQNKMYVVVGSTEEAQKLSNAQLNELVRAARNKASADGIEDAFLNTECSIFVEYNGSTYQVWYHNADDQTDYNESGNYGWEQLEGSYTVPNGQYRTRLFFVSDPDSSTNAQNAGNLIDVASAGQYKQYLIEYYTQTYVDGQLQTTYVGDRSETGEALVYSAVQLQNYDYFIKEKRQYLYQVLVNGNAYPYALRYANNAQLYIQKYEGAPTKPEGTNSPNNYDNYDIVMHVYLRDIVVGVQKELKFPTALTEEQKLNIMADLNTNDGYKADFTLSSPDTDYTFTQDATAVITARDPAGNYKGYIAMGDGLQMPHNFQVEETSTSAIPGLILDEVKIDVTTYQAGIEAASHSKTYNRGENDAALATPLKSDDFWFTDGDTPDNGSDDIKIADVRVTNTYAEKETTVYYKAIGKGKIKLDQANAAFEDKPSEKLLFYSGKAIGCSVTTGAGASFVGWYKDEGCTIPVTAADGVVGSDGSFTPNANIINADEITFYAKFETYTVAIERENGEPGKTYVYDLECDPTEAGKPNFTMQVSVTCDANGYGKTEVMEAPAGNYTATELESWSWRHNGSPKRSGTVTETQRYITLTFGDARTILTWLDGFGSPAKNVQGTK